MSRVIANIISIEIKTVKMLLGFKWSSNITICKLASKSLSLFTSEKKKNIWTYRFGLKLSSNFQFTELGEGRIDIFWKFLHFSLVFIKKQKAPLAIKACLMQGINDRVSGVADTPQM